MKNTNRNEVTMFELITDKKTLELAQKVESELQGRRDKAAFDLTNEILLEYAQDSDPVLWEMMPAAAAQIAADKVQRAWAVQDMLGFIDYDKFA